MSQPLRVLHFQGRMGLGGAETFMMNTYRNIDRSKVQFDFLLYDDYKEVSPYHDEIERLGGRIFYVTNPKKNIIKYIREVRRLLKKQTFDIIHSQVFFGSGLNVLLASKAGIKKRIVHSHATSHESEKNIIFKIIKKLLDKLMFRYSTDFLACSNDAGYALFGKNKNFIFVPNGIDLDKYREKKQPTSNIRAELGIRENTFVVGNVGRFEMQKNHTFLIDIFKSIIESQPNSHLLLIGEGSLEEQIKRKVKEMGLENNVAFLGLRNDISDILKEIDVFLMPSLYEGLPISAVEAQASGNKLVLSDTISKETKLTENVQFISLEKPAEYWKNCVLSEPFHNKALSELEKYDMKNTSRIMESIYLSGRKTIEDSTNMERA